MSVKYFLHAKALCESKQVGDGTRIWAHAHVMDQAIVGTNCNLGESVFIESGAVVGNHCTLKNGVYVWEGVILEDYVFVGPNATFTNDNSPRTFHKDWKSRGFRETRISRGATLGANCTILCGINVGPFAMVGAGAVVTKSVPAHGIVAGVPARLIGKACFCGKTLDKEENCIVCNRVLSSNSFEYFLKN